MFLGKAGSDEHSFVTGHWVEVLRDVTMLDFDMLWCLEKFLQIGLTMPVILRLDMLPSSLILFGLLWPPNQAFCQFHCWA